MSFLFSREPAKQSPLLDLELVMGLEIHPESICRPEVPGRSESGVCRDSTLRVQDLVDPSRGHADGLGQPVLA